MNSKPNGAPTDSNPTDHGAVRRAASALLARGFQELQSAKVIPRPRYTPWIEVGRDYEGSALNAPEMKTFEEALVAAFPNRFTGDLMEKESVSQYAFGLLEGAVAAITRSAAPYVNDGPIASKAIEELLALLKMPGQEAVVARIVSDLVLPGNAAITVGPVQILPAAGPGFMDAARVVEQIVPGAAQEMWRTQPFIMADDLSVVVTRGTAQGDRLWPAYDMAARQGSRRISTFVTAVRLATGPTTENIVEIVGQAGFVRAHRPRVEYFRHQSLALAARRSASLDASRAAALTKLSEELQRWEGADPNKSTALGIALARLNRSYEAAPWSDQLVDLCVGLEAALLGGAEQEEISLKLRSRAASLLSTPSDSPDAIYNDVKILYNLRSRIMHGSTLSNEQAKSRLKGFTTSARSPYGRDQGNLALDRLRDILRRAILARAFLDEQGLWRLTDKDLDVDRQLIDNAERSKWQEAWRTSLVEMNLPTAPDPAPPPKLWIDS
jgi:hypothetical protein